MAVDGISYRPLDVDEISAREYAHKAHKFATYGDNIAYPLLGLAEEAGEVAGKAAKWIRKNGGRMDMENDPALREDMKKELGDCAWMMNELMLKFGFTWEQIFCHNVERLQDRLNRGVIVGSGDNR